MLLLEAHGLEKYIADRLIFKQNESIHVYRGDRIGIVGLNGAGKTTLLRLLCGEEQPVQGYVRRHGRTAVVRQFSERGGEEPLSGGERTRRNIAAAMAQDADLLFADEPTSHLDLTGIQELEQQLRAYRGAVVLISHDRTLLDAVCTKVIEVEDGRLTEYPGNYSEYRGLKAQKQVRVQFEYDQYHAEKTRLLAAAAEKKEHANRIGKPPKGLSSKEIRLGKPHFNRKQSKAERTVKAIEKRISQLETVDKPKEMPTVTFDLNLFSPVHSKKVLTVEPVTRSAGERMLFRDLRMTVKPGSKVAVIGGNGSGKTTLLRMIASALPGNSEAAGAAERNAIRFADSAKVGCFDQTLAALDESKTILHNVKESSRFPETFIRTVLARLLFKRDEVLKPVRLLSGGERVKTLLSKVFLSDCNVLILDEPTNYLDLFTRQELETVLRDYPGTILFATHDRSLLGRVADHVLVLEGEGEWTFFAGSYDAYVESCGNTPRADTAQEEEERLLTLENELNVVIGRLSMPQRGDSLPELEERYRQLSAEVKRLRTKLRK